jgi:hypothetical protein
MIGVFARKTRKSNGCRTRKTEEQHFGEHCGVVVGFVGGPHESFKDGIQSFDLIEVSESRPVSCADDRKASNRHQSVLQKDAGDNSKLVLSA